MEAAYALRGPVAAGTWGLVGDGLVLGDQVQSVRVLFEVIWRRIKGTSLDDQVLLSVEHVFARDAANPFSAVPFSTTVAGDAAAAAAGDSLVLRATVTGGDAGAVYILNGDGASTNGSIPRLDLPQTAAQ